MATGKSSATTVRCAFKGGENNNFHIWGTPLPVYHLPILCPKYAANPKAYHINGVFQRYEVYTLKKVVNGEGLYYYQGQVTVQTITYVMMMLSNGFKPTFRRNPKK